VRGALSARKSSKSSGALRTSSGRTLSNHDRARAGYVCAIVNAASQPQRNHPAHPVPSPGRGFMSFVPGPETVRAAESEAGQLQGGARCAPIPSSIVGGGRWSSDRASHARASGSRGSREQEHSGTSIWRLRAPPAAAHGRPGLGEPRRRAAQRCSAVQCSAGLMQVTAVDRGGNRASAHPVLGHFSEARGRGEDGEDPHCPHSGCSLWCETAYYRLLSLKAAVGKGGARSQRHAKRSAEF
jgi:hypothetical protein